MRSVVASQLRLARLGGDGVGRNLQLDGVDHGCAHVRIRGGDIQFLASLYEQFLANHVVQHLVPLRGRRVLQVHPVQGLQLQQVVAAGDGLLIDQRHSLRRDDQGGGAASGEERVAGHQQSGEGAPAHQNE